MICSPYNGVFIAYYLTSCYAGRIICLHTIIVKCKNLPHAIIRIQDIALHLPAALVLLVVQQSTNITGSRFVVLPLYRFVWHPRITLHFLSKYIVESLLLFCRKKHSYDANNVIEAIVRGMHLSWSFTLQYLHMLL